MRICVATLVVAIHAFLIVSGCSREESRPERTDEKTSNSTWKIVEEKDLSAAQRSQLAQAQKGRGALFGRLLSELTQALGKGGPASAIEVCRDRAPELAREVSREQGIEIGRTSFKLRNPKNAPPEWCAELVERRVETATCVELSGGRLGAFLPIRIMNTCLKCHGPEEGISPEVKKALSENYPQDQATGFREGDLRGWFWVEVPRA